METCPDCRKSFPDGALLNVFIERGGQFTQQLLCRSCGLRATQGLHGMEIKAPTSAASILSRAESDLANKKWWQFWK